MGAWAETVVHGAINPYPPVDGEECASCNHVFVKDERAFRVTEREDREWVCGKCAGEPDPANEPMGA